MALEGPPLLLALKNPPGPVQCVLIESAEGTEPDPDVLESLDFLGLMGTTPRGQWPLLCPLGPPGEADSQSACLEGMRGEGESHRKP